MCPSDQLKKHERNKKNIKKQFIYCFFLFLLCFLRVFLIMVLAHKPLCASMYMVYLPKLLFIDSM